MICLGTSAGLEGSLEDLDGDELLAIAGEEQAVGEGEVGAMTGAEDLDLVEGFERSGGGGDDPEFALFGDGQEVGSNADEGAAGDGGGLPAFVFGGEVDAAQGLAAFLATVEAEGDLAIDDGGAVVAVEEAFFGPEGREAGELQDVEADVVAGGEHDEVAAEEDGLGGVHAGFHVGSEAMMGGDLAGGCVEQPDFVAQPAENLAGTHGHGGSVAGFIGDALPDGLTVGDIEGDDTGGFAIAGAAGGDDDAVAEHQRGACAAEETLGRFVVLDGVDLPEGLAGFEIERVEYAVGTVNEDPAVGDGRHTTGAVIEAEAVDVIGGAFE